MKSLLCAVAWLGASILSHAQVLPVPNARNPDWVLAKATSGFRLSRPDSLPGGRDRMPIVKPNREGPKDAIPMPNGLSQRITSIGDRHEYWDAARQLRYEWQSRTDQVGPDSLVTVRQQATGATFTYRRAPKQWKSRQSLPIKK